MFEALGQMILAIIGLILVVALIAAAFWIFSTVYVFYGLGGLAVCALVILLLK